MKKLEMANVYRETRDLEKWLICAERQKIQKEMADMRRETRDEKYAHRN